MLDKDTIKNEIMPHLSVAKRGYVSKYPLVDVVNAILYKLKTGCQWEYLPVGHLFCGEAPSYKTVFHHYRKWCKLGDWQKMFTSIVQNHKRMFDLSVSNIDGSHTPAVKGGERVGYQGRKKRKTTNSIFFTDRNGLPLAMSEPEAGNHADLYGIGRSVDGIVMQLERAGINCNGLFNNADAGFDGMSFRAALRKHGIIDNVCPNPRNGRTKQNHNIFDVELYKNRWVIERTNAWMDSFRSVLTRFDTTLSSWSGWNYLTFTIICIKTFHRIKKFR